MLIERELIINKGIDETWQVLGPQFKDAYKWASVVNHSEGFGEGENGAPCTERACDISGMGKTKEKILAYDNDKHLLSYAVVGQKMPSMVKSASNTWQLFSAGPNQTKLKMELHMEIVGLMGKIMAPMMKMQMGKMARTTSDDFKYYVENGQVSAQKIKALKKQKR